MNNALILLAATALQLSLLWLAFSGPEDRPAGSRRLQAVRLRHAGPVSEIASGRAEALVRKSSPGSRASATPKSRWAALTKEIGARLHRTGKGWSLRRYLETSAAIGVGVTGLMLLRTGSLAPSLLLGVGAAMLLPYAVVGDLIGRRKRAFIIKFPEAIELLVCGLRSGLPVSETLGLVTAEVPGPVGQEFKLVTERMRIGRNMEDALQESAERLGIPEFNFFCITLAIHRETGGNLTETLVNLADVLRKRAQMTLKIRAMSSESRASAMILGSLPFVVFLLIWNFSPGYLSGFFTDHRLITAGIGGMVWMSIGALVMARMVRFEI